MAQPQKKSSPHKDTHFLTGKLAGLLSVPDKNDELTVILSFLAWD